MLTSANYIPKHPTTETKERYQSVSRRFVALRRRLFRNKVIR